MSRILVTGGAGFLGSHLCDRLVVVLEEGLKETTAHFRALLRDT